MTEDEGDRALLARYRAGDGTVAEEIVSRFRAPLVRFAGGYVGARDAEDVVQEVLLGALKPKGGLGACPKDLRAWLYAVTRNHCLNVCRARGRRDTRPLPEDFDLAASLTGPVTRLEKQEAARRLDQIVEGLPAEQREVLRLRYTEELSREQIASVLEIAPSLVKTRLFAAMQSLRREV